jgi:chloramphenicol O-acetyltransferase
MVIDPQCQGLSADGLSAGRLYASSGLRITPFAIQLAHAATDAGRGFATADATRRVYLRFESVQIS